MDNHRQYAYSRRLDLDAIRTVALVRVLMVHVSAYIVLAYPLPSGKEFIVGNLFNGLFRAGVPLFIMLTGALLLDEDRAFDVKKFYKNSLLPMVWLTIGWLLAYGAFYAAVLPALRGEPASAGAFWDFLLSFQGSNYPHLWYMFFLVGMYLSIPILRLFVKRENKPYILGLILGTVVFAYLVNTLNVFTRNSTITVSAFAGKFHMEYLTSYLGYLLLGWYLTNFRPEKKQRIILYVLGAAAVCLSIITVQLSIGRIPNIRGFVYEQGTLPMLFYSCASFVLISEVCRGKTTTNRVFVALGKWGFGIYMIHVAYLELFTQVILPYASFGLQSPFLYILLCFAFTAAASLVTVGAVSRVKYLKKIFYIK